MQSPWLLHIHHCLSMGVPSPPRASQIHFIHGLLGLREELGKSLLTTNIIESMNSCIALRLLRIKRWMSSDHRHRWAAMAIMDTEPRLKRIPNAKWLPKLRAALQKEIRKNIANESPELLPLFFSFN